MLLKAPSELLVGYLTGQRQREASGRALPSLCVRRSKESGLISAKAPLPSCVMVEGGLDTGV